MPDSARLESVLGVRFTQAALVGDGGLIELRYTVLDTEKATEFQSDTQHPPVIYSERNRSAPVYRTALMRQGHNLRRARATSSSTRTTTAWCVAVTPSRSTPGPAS